MAEKNNGIVPLYIDLKKIKLNFFKPFCAEYRSMSLGKGKILSFLKMVQTVIREIAGSVILKRNTSIEEHALFNRNMPILFNKGILIEGRNFDLIRKDL